EVASTWTNGVARAPNCARMSNTPSPGTPQMANQPLASALASTWRGSLWNPFLSMSKLRHATVMRAPATGMSLSASRTKPTTVPLESPAAGAPQSAVRIATAPGMDSSTCTTGLEPTRTLREMAWRSSSLSSACRKPMMNVPCGTPAMRNAPDESVSAENTCDGSSRDTSCTTAPESGAERTLSYTTPSTVAVVDAPVCCALGRWTGMTRVQRAATVPLRKAFTAPDRHLIHPLRKLPTKT